MPRARLENDGLQYVALPPNGFGFDVEWSGWTGTQSKYWLRGSQGYVFFGDGPDATHVFPEGDTTIFVGPEAKHFELRDCTLHCGSRKGIHLGLSHPHTGPKPPPLSFALRNVRILCDVSTVWGLFAYCANQELEDVEIWLENSFEHPSYLHGASEPTPFSTPGLRWRNVRVYGSGGECAKVANRPEESHWVSGIRAEFEDCLFQNWYQPHSWRGGAGVNLAGLGGQASFLHCEFRGGHASRGKCLMVGDGAHAYSETPHPVTGKLSPPRYFSAIDGTPGKGPAISELVVTECAFSASGTENYSVMTRVGSEDPYRTSCVAGLVHYRGCGLYGDHVQAQMRLIDEFKMTGCNRPPQRRWMEIKGHKTEHEAMLSYAGAWTPCSQDV